MRTCGQRVGRKIEVFETDIGIVQNRIEDDVRAVEVPSDDRPDFGSKSFLVPLLRVVAEFEIRSVKEFAIVRFRHGKQRAQLKAIQRGALILS